MRDDEVLRIEAQVTARHRDQASQRQTGRDQQHDGNRNLGDDQPFAKPTLTEVGTDASRRRTTRLEISTDHGQRWRQSTDRVVNAAAAIAKTNAVRSRPTIAVSTIIRSGMRTVTVFKPGR